MKRIGAQRGEVAVMETKRETSLAALVEQARETHGVSKEEFARLAGISKKTLWWIEREERPVTHWTRFKVLSAIRRLEACSQNRTRNIEFE